MFATDEAIIIISEQLENIDKDIETKTNEIKELKKIRRKLINSIKALESL